MNTQLRKFYEADEMGGGGDPYQIIKNLNKRIKELESESAALPVTHDKEDAISSISSNLYNIRNSSNQPMMDTGKCDEIAEFIYNDLKEYFGAVGYTKEDIPFSVDFLWNDEIRPNEDMKKYMGDSYDNYVKEWQEKENKVWFLNTQVSYDSCDCGDGYGCSHGSWPYEIHFSNNDKRCTGDFEDETSLILTGINNGIRIDDYTKITMHQFINLCELVGINLEYKPAASLPAPVDVGVRENEK